MSTVVVCSGKGSPGATFGATNLASAMARTGQVVLLMDLDPVGGDLCCYLGLDPRRGVYPLLRMDGVPTDPDRLLAEAEQRSGFLALSGFPEASELATAETLRAVLKVASASWWTVVADIGRVSEANAPVAADAELVILVVRPDLVSVLGAERALRILETAGVRGEKVAALVCGLDRRRPADRAEVADALRIPVLGCVPFDRRGARKALLAQAPATSWRLKRAFRPLAATVRGAIDEAAPSHDSLIRELQPAEVTT
jgi:Flp pilus assembly CpaE family ATPase